MAFLRGCASSCAQGMTCFFSLSAACLMFSSQQWLLYESYLWCLNVIVTILCSEMKLAHENCSGQRSYTVQAEAKEPFLLLETHDDTLQVEKCVYKLDRNVCLKGKCTCEKSCELEGRCLAVDLGISTVKKNLWGQRKSNIL